MLIKENGVIMADKILKALFSGAPLQIRTQIVIHTDNAVSTMANAGMLISSKLYPVPAVTATPAGKRIVSTNNRYIEIEIAFFIWRTYSFPNIFAYLFDKSLDKAQNTAVNDMPIPLINKSACRHSKLSAKAFPINSLEGFIS